jgi:hypothetical protein
MQFLLKKNHDNLEKNIGSKKLDKKNHPELTQVSLIDM